MIFVLRNRDGTIKTFAENGDDFVLAPGESLERVETGFTEFARRLKISAEGRSGETLFLSAGTETVEMRVSCPGQAAIPLQINNEEMTVMLEDGEGVLRLSVADGMTYLIRPLDRREYCAGGDALLTVVVEQAPGGR